MKRKNVIILFVVGVCLLGQSPVWSKFGRTKTSVTFTLHHPPAFVALDRELRIEGRSSDPQYTGIVKYAESLLEQQLSAENYRVSPSAKTSLRFAVTQASASVERQTRMEWVNVHTGVRNVNFLGKSTQVENCALQQSRVQYTISSGRLSLSVSASTVQPQAVLFTRAFAPAYREESATGGPQRCGGAQYVSKPGQQLDQQAILRRLAEQAAGEIRCMVAGRDEPRNVLLAVDDELRSGNASALAGNWAQALDAWKAASIRKSPTEAARQYNLGVAHEALASDAMRKGSLDEANSHLDDAEKCYKQALSLDAGEKYFSDTLARLQNDRSVLQKEEESDFIKQVVEAPRETKPSGPVTTDIPLDGWPAGEAADVHSYRAYVRLRVTANEKDISESFKAKLANDAETYHLSAGQGTQIVESEVNRLRVVRHNQDEYRQLFRESVADGVITPEKREVLRGRQQSLSLSDAQVKQVELEFKFRETR
jgi:tetratricopeptide (TPR) repeat protein